MSHYVIQSFPTGKCNVCQPIGVRVKIHSCSDLCLPQRILMQFLALKVQSENESRCCGASINSTCSRSPWSTGVIRLITYFSEQTAVLSTVYGSIHTLLASQVKTELILVVFVPSCSSLLLLFSRGIYHYYNPGSIPNFFEFNTETMRRHNFLQHANVSIHKFWHRYKKNTYFNTFR